MRTRVAAALRPEIELEAWRDVAELAQGPRFELADTLARDAEARADLLERLRDGTVETEAVREHVTHARIQPLQRVRELLGTQAVGSLHVGLDRLRVFDHVAVQALAVADRRLQAHGVLDELEQLADPLRREAALEGDLVVLRRAVQLLREDPARARDAAHLVGDVHG